MSHLPCLTSRLHIFLGSRLIGTPDELGIGKLAHIYEIQADRIRSEQLQSSDTQFLKQRIASSQLVRQMTRRVGKLSSIALVVLMSVGLAVVGSIHGVKSAAAHAETSRKQAEANANACTSFRAVHMSPLPTYCN